MGLLDTIISGYKNGMGLLAPNDQDLEMRAEIAKGLLGFAPSVGDAISGYDAVQSARQGNYGEAALNGIGLLPFIPSMGGLVKHIPAPSWNTQRKMIPVGINPTKEERMALFADKQSKTGDGATLRLLKDQKTGTYYAWPADAALHQDVGNYFKLDPDQTRHLIDAL